jgi:hypothetical protein
MPANARQHALDKRREPRAAHPDQLPATNVIEPFNIVDQIERTGPNVIARQGRYRHMIVAVGELVGDPPVTPRRQPLVPDPPWRRPVHLDLRSLTPMAPDPARYHSGAVFPDRDPLTRAATD